MNEVVVDVVSKGLVAGVVVVSMLHVQVGQLLLSTPDPGVPPLGQEHGRMTGGHVGKLDVTMADEDAGVVGVVTGNVAGETVVGKATHRHVPHPSTTACWKE